MPGILVFGAMAFPLPPVAPRAAGQVIARQCRSHYDRLGEIMADQKDLIGERGRSLETDYFRRRDQELLERAREQEAAAQRRRQLAAALGVDEQAVTALAALGFDGATAPLLDIVPAIQVAWSDGTLPAAERAVLERIMARPELQPAAAAGAGMVSEWLSRQPGADLFRLATEALRLRVDRLDAGARTQLVAQIIGDCKAVAAASGGVFGLGALSSAEADRIRELAAALGVKS